MKFIPDKSISILLLLVIVLLFWVNIEIGIIVEGLCLTVIFVIDRKCVKMFSNLGFLIFLIIAIGVPLVVDFSPDTLKKNIFILFRGVLIFLWLYFYTKNFTSTGAYTKLKSYLPLQLIELVQLSVNLLPEMQKTAYAEFKKVKITRNTLLNPIVNFFYAFIKAGENLSVSINSDRQKKLIIIAGKIHEGKTTLASKLASILTSAGYKVGGILSVAENINGKRHNYYAVDLKSGRKVKLVTKDKIDDFYDKFWAYYFLKEGMNFATNCLSHEYLEGVDAVFLDEIGAMELEDKGFSKQIPIIMNLKVRVVCFVIRDQFIEHICKKFGIVPSEIIKTGCDDDNLKYKLQETQITT